MVYGLLIDQLLVYYCTWARHDLWIGCRELTHFACGTHVHTSPQLRDSTLLCCSGWTPTAGKGCRRFMETFIQHTRQRWNLKNAFYTNLNKNNKTQTQRYLFFQWKQWVTIYKCEHFDSKALGVSRKLNISAGHWKQSGLVTILIIGTSKEGTSDFNYSRLKLPTIFFVCFLNENLLDWKGHHNLKLINVCTLLKKHL